MIGRARPDRSRELRQVELRIQRAFFDFCGNWPMSRGRFITKLSGNSVEIPSDAESTVNVAPTNLRAWLTREWIVKVDDRPGEREFEVTLLGVEIVRAFRVENAA